MDLQRLRTRRRVLLTCCPDVPALAGLATGVTVVLGPWTMSVATAAGVSDLAATAAAAAAAAGAAATMTAGELVNTTAAAASSGGVDLICLFGRCVDLSLSGFSWADAPLSSLRYPVGVMFVYLAVIWALHRTMRSRPPIRMKAAAAVHNILLTGLSAAMAVGTIVELVINTRRHGFVSVVCDREKTAMTGRLAVWFYVFYLSKYYELLDTVLLVVKKRPLSFLHVYHHCVVLILFWAYNQSRMIISWVLVVANSLVHVAMYGYFTASTFGKTVWWKKYITQAQIVQFVVDLTATWPFPLLYYGARGCSGSMRGWLFGQAVGFSFFHLFLDFYRRSYKKRGDAAAIAVVPAGVSPQVVADGGAGAAPTASLMAKKHA